MKKSKKSIDNIEIEKKVEIRKRGRPRKKQPVEEVIEEVVEQPVEETVTEPESIVALEPSVEPKKKTNPWLAHVRKFKEENPDVRNYRNILKLAKESYKKQ